MSRLNSGAKCAVVARVSARAAAVAALLSVAGCASASHPYTAPNVTAESVTAESVAVADTSRVAQSAQVEDEGRPAQAVPTIRVRELADDPGEPYSKTYGGNNPSAAKRAEPEQKADPQVPARTPIPAAKIPADLPPAFRRKLASAMLADE